MAHGEYFHLEVTPKNPGDFGFAFMSGFHRTPEEAESLANQIKRDILRHVEDISQIIIVWENEDA